MTQDIQAVSAAFGFSETIARATQRVNLLTTLAYLDPLSGKLASNGQAHTFKFPQISPLKNYCGKTGQEIGAHSESALRAAFDTHGAEYLERALLAGNLLGIAPNWLQSDSAALDRLQETEPHAYAVYLLGELTRKPIRGNPHLAKRDIGQGTTERHWQIVRAFAILSLLQKHELATLNACLRRAVSFLPDAGIYLQRCLGFVELHGKKFAIAPDHLARYAVEGSLIGAINVAIAAMVSNIHEFKEALVNNRVWDSEQVSTKMARALRTKILTDENADNERAGMTHPHFVEVPTRGATGWKLLGNIKPGMYQEKPRTIEHAKRGPSNVRGQKRHVLLNEEEFDLSEAIFGSVSRGTTPKDQAADVRALMAKVLANKKETTPEDIATADAFASLFDDELERDAQENPDGVFVRIAPPHVVASLKPLPLPGPAPLSAPSAAPLTMAERMAQRLAAKAAEKAAIPAPIPATIAEPAKPLSIAARALLLKSKKG